MVMEIEDTASGRRRAVHGRCGVIPDPTVDQLADIAVSTAALRGMLASSRVSPCFFFDQWQRVRIRRRTKRPGRDRWPNARRNNYFGADFRRRIAGDAALVLKSPNENCAKARLPARERPDFPDLNSGNISRATRPALGRANAYGQYLLASTVRRRSSPRFDAHDISASPRLSPCNPLIPKTLSGRDAHLPGE